MNENLSNHAVIYAILALNSEIELQKDYLDSPEVPVDEKENEEEILSDLEQAFMEFIDLYKQRCKQDVSLPDIDTLLSDTV